MARQLMHENESIYLPIGSDHRLANPGKIDLELIEVQRQLHRRGCYRADRGRLPDLIGRDQPSACGCSTKTNRNAQRGG